MNTGWHLTSIMTLHGQEESTSWQTIRYKEICDRGAMWWWYHNDDHRQICQSETEKGKGVAKQEAEILRLILEFRANGTQNKTRRKERRLRMTDVQLNV